MRGITEEYKWTKFPKRHPNRILTKMGKIIETEVKLNHFPNNSRPVILLSSKVCFWYDKDNINPAQNVKCR